MNNRRVVKLSNVIGIASIVLLIYWVFIFIAMTVFDFKVFRENLTESFYMSVLGILALMFGALMINIMFNLTRIAEKHNQDGDAHTKKSVKTMTILFIASFPLIFAFLFGGDYLTSVKKEKILVSSARSIVENDPAKSEKLLDYSFDKGWITETAEILKYYSKIDSNFPNVSVIVADKIDGSDVFLGFETYAYFNPKTDTIPPNKIEYIRETTKEEREYLGKVFFENDDTVRFSSYRGTYELFYPYSANGKTIVLYFSEYQRYGKIGS